MAHKDPMLRSKVWMPKKPAAPSAGDYVLCIGLLVLLALIIIGLWTMAFSDPIDLHFKHPSPAPAAHAAKSAK